MRGALLGASAFAAIVGALYLAEARRYSTGTTAQPGPGLYPTLIGVVVLVAAVGVALEAARSPSAVDIAWPRGDARRRVLAILLPTAAYVLLLDVLGHALAGSLLTLIVLHVMGMRRWWLEIAVALAVGLGSHYIFATLLGVPLPAGLWRG